MCNPFKAISRAVAPVTKVVERAITPPGTGAAEAAAEQQTAALNQQTALLKQAQDAALQQQQDAAKAAAAASVPPEDNESSVQASEARLRKLIAGSGATSSGARFLGQAPVGYRLLTGE
jgi:hypothetical protein